MCFPNQYTSVDYKWISYVVGCFLAAASITNLLKYCNKDESNEQVMQEQPDPMKQPIY